jgi:hypothetical protein
MSVKSVPPGISGRTAQYTGNVDTEILSNELALLNLGSFVPLNINIDLTKYMQEIKQFDDSWVEYLPRIDRPNNRKALTLLNLPGKTHTDVPSLAEASYAAGRRLSELEFNQPTDVYHACTCLQPFLDQWQPLGRTFIVRSDIGGYFVPHRDHPSMPRECFRLIVFLNNVGPLQYDWLMDDRKMEIQPGQVYYVNTRMTHRTISWVDNSHHLILNVPFTTANVAKVIASLAHTH